MSVVVSRQDVDSWHTELTIEVPQPAVEAETQRVLGDWRKKVKMPGFRQGKVPASVVRQRYAEEIGRDVVERLVGRYWQQAQAEAGIKPLLPPLIEDVDHELGTKLSFVAKVDVRPPIELRDFRTWELPELPVEPTEEEVDLALEDLQRSAGAWREVERPAGRGDRVVGEIEAEGSDDGPQRLRVEVGGEGVWEELTLALTGVVAGAETTFDHGEDGAPKTHYRVKVEQVQELEPATIDDELAKKLGVADAAALRDAIRHRIEHNKKDQRRQRREHTFLQRLVEEHPLEPSERLIESELRGMVEDYARELHGRGVDLERAELDWARIGDEMRPQAKRRIQIRLLLDAIVDAEDVEVPEDKLEATLASLAKGQGISAGHLRQHLARDGRLQRLRADLARQTALLSVLDPA
jgi:trigger factor